jgi:tetratricopeptide (TPR) repeat protein
MGRKRARARKYIYFYIAGLISIVLLSCASSEKMEVKIKEQAERRQEQNLLRSEELLFQGDYEAALEECQKILSLSSPEYQKDKALFNIGVIYANPENPKKDYGKSLGSFKRLMKDYPRSPLVDQAKTWIGVLLENERLIQRNERLSQINEKLGQTVENLNRIIEKSKQVDLEIEEMKREKPK